MMSQSRWRKQWAYAGCLIWATQTGYAVDTTLTADQTTRVTLSGATSDTLTINAGVSLDNTTDGGAPSVFADGNTTITNAGVINNTGAGSGATILHNSTTAGLITIINSGTINKHTGNDYAINADGSANTGLDLTVQSGAVIAGAIRGQNAAGDALKVDADFTTGGRIEFMRTISVNNSGTDFTVSHAISELDSSLQIGAPGTTDVTLTNSSDGTINGAGTYTNYGTWTVNGIVGAIDGTAVVVNHGTMNINAAVTANGNNFENRTGATAVISAPVDVGVNNFQNQGTATVTLESDVTAALFDNAATGTVTVTGNRTINGAYTNPGNHNFTFGQTLTVTGGAANLDNATVTATSSSLWLADGATSNIVSSDVSMSAAGATLGIAQPPNVTYAMVVNGNDLQITVDRTPYGTLGENTNARTVGGILDDALVGASADFQEVASGIDSSSATNSDISKSLLALLPDLAGASAAAGSTIQNGSFSTITDRTSALRIAMTDTRGLSAGYSPNANEASWGQFYFTTADQNGRNDLPGYETDTWGLTIGADRLLSVEHLLGFAVSYADSDVNTKAVTSSSLNFDTYQAFIYGTYAPRCYFIDWAASIAYNDYDSLRRVAIPNGIVRNATGRYNALQPAIRIHAGAHRLLGSVQVIPHANVHLSRLGTSRYSESGAGAISLLDVEHKSVNIFEVGAGVKVTWNDTMYEQETAMDRYVSKRQGMLIPEFHTGMMVDLLNETPSIISRFAGGGPAFSVDAAKPASTSVNVGGSLTYMAGQRFYTNVGYDFTYKSGFDAHNVALSLRWVY